MGKIFRTVFLGLFALLGSAILLYSLWSIYMTHASRTWPSTRGTIVEANCASSHGRAGTTYPSTRSRHVLFQYQVNGDSYTSDRESFGIPVAGRDCAAGCSKGQAVNVYYDPSNPGEAVLNVGTYSRSRFGVVVGLIFIGFALFGYWRDVRNRDT
ncbi:MAG TPA: DUF3592 domain-containing protein [Gammaproteobacteria bacterium]|nr:DUF3592 domain-containing protein [Gammaproteobacteria bacterium]